MKKFFTLALMCIMAFAGFSQDPGTLNQSFGANGVARIAPSSYFDFISGMMETKEEKIIAVGRTRTDGSNYSVYSSRLNSDGTLDQTYGNNGFVRINAREYIYLNSAKDAVLNDDDLLYICGYTYDYENNTAFVIRIDQNGFPDPYFGEEGVAQTEYGGGIVYESIDLDSHGRPIVTGYLNDTLIVRRYNVAGGLDPTFGDNGTTFLSADNTLFSFGFAVKVLPDNRIIVAGTKVYEGEQIHRPIVCRFKANGTLDNTFGNNGIVDIDITEQGTAYALSISTQGENYIIAGHSEIPTPDSDLPRSEVYVTRILQDGTIDTSFGTDGYTKYEMFSGEGCTNDCYGVKTAEDGQIFGTFYAYNFTNAASRAYVFNVDADGTPKESFSGTGVMPFDFTEPEIQTSEVLLRNNGTLLVGGYLYDGNVGSEVFIANINTDIIPETPENPSAELQLTAETIDCHTVKATIIPNEYTTEYHTGIISMSMFEQMGVDVIVQALQADGNPLTGTQEVTFENLNPLTEYIVVATAKNEIDEWIVETELITTPDCTGYDEYDAAEVSVYPNPATSSLFVETTIGNAQVDIIDITGRCLKSIETTDNVSTINIQDIDEGIYFIVIQNESNRIVEKLIVK